MPPATARRTNRLRQALRLLFTLLPVASAHAQEVWLPEGLDGHVITALSVAPGAAGILYAGTETGESFRSEDGAQSWFPASLGLPAAPVHDLDVSPADPGLVYAATEQGLYRSADAGASWGLSGNGLPAAPFVAVAVDPINPAVVFASANEPVPGRLHVFKSANGGDTWESVRIQGPGFGTPDFSWVKTLAFRPGTSTVHAGWHDVVFFTEDGGAVWRLYPDAGNDVLVLLPDPFDTALIYIGTFSGGMARSVSQGAWSFGAGLEGTMVVALAADPLRPGWLYAAAGGAVHRSLDHGATWSRAGGELPAAKSLAISPDGVVRAGTADGVVRLGIASVTRARIVRPLVRRPPIGLNPRD